MKITLPTVILSFTLGGILAVGGFYLLTPADRNEGVNVAAEKTDAALVGPVDVALHGTYHGAGGEYGAFIAQYRTYSESGKAAVVKTIFKHDAVYYHSSTGHYVLYQYFQGDAVEHDRLVYPEIEEGAGVWSKSRVRFFDSHGAQTKHQYLRADGKLASEVNLLTGEFTSYFANGYDWREHQVSDSNGKLIGASRYRTNGDVWWSTGADMRTHVYFDLHGAPINREFTSESANKNGIFIMGSNDNPKLHQYDKYWRPDGTLAYIQTWYRMYDHSDHKFKDALGSVSVFDNTGKKTIATYNLEIRPQSQPRFVKEVYFYQEDGGTLVGKYGSPNQLASQEMLNADGSRSAHTVDQSLWSANQVDDILFQGFDHDLWGTPDVNPHDI